MSLEHLDRRRGGEEKVEKATEIVDGLHVDIVAKTFPGSEREPDRAFVFLPGYSISASDKSAEEISRAYAQFGKCDTITISTQCREQGIESPPDGTDFLYEQAKAIANYLTRRGVKRLTIGGHSQGGNKAIGLAAALQEHVNVEGLILINIPGLYEQDLAAMRNSNARQPLRRPAPREVEERREQLDSDMQKNGALELLWNPFTYWLRFQSELNEANAKNPHTADVKVPVVLVMANGDPFSDAERLAPGAKQMPLEERETFLKEKVFPNAPRVDLLVPEKYYSHNLPIEAPEKVAQTTLYMLQRAHREDGGAV